VINNHIVMEDFLYNNMRNRWLRYFKKAFKLSPNTFSIKAEFLCSFQQTKHIGTLFICGGQLPDTRDRKFKVMESRDGSQAGCPTIGNITLLYPNRFFH